MESTIETAKRKAAYAAVDNHIKSGFVVGIGSGSTVVYAVERIVELTKKGKLAQLICIPTSFQSTQLIVEGGLELSDLSRHPQVDVCIDGADEVDECLNVIKGGGGCATQEKIVAYNSKYFIIIADSRKRSQRLGQVWKAGVPIDVLPSAYIPLTKVCKETFGAKSATLRMCKGGKAGPVVTDIASFVVDADFGAIKLSENDEIGGSSLTVKDLESRLSCVPGVVSCGLFVGMADICYFGEMNGSVSVLKL
eukprot:Sdes_comp20931_c0_seq2m18361